MKNNQKILLSFFLIFFVFQTIVKAQIKIGENPTVLNTSAILEIESVNKGLLLPRLALIDTSSSTPLLHHVAGMIVYNTAAQNGLMEGFYYNNGTNGSALTNRQLSG